MAEEREYGKNGSEEGVASSSEEREPSGGAYRSGVRGEPFAVRMGDAGYSVGRKYDALKNAFLSYRSQGKTGKPVKSRMTRDGETFSAGRTNVGKICLVGGYLRLFLALDPEKFNKDKYHHKDYSDVVKYARYPFMIKISSDRQLKYALELIEAVMTNNGYAADPDYLPGDQAHIFKKSRGKRSVIAEKIFVPAPAPAEDERENGNPGGEELAERVVSCAEDHGSEPRRAVEEVRLPVRAAVLDANGVKIGKIRKSVWYDGDEEYVGEFVREDTNVYYVRRDERRGFVDKNDNVIAFDNTYVATVRYARGWLIAVIAVAIALVAVLSALLAAYFTPKSESPDYAPTLFVADNGTEWNENRNLPVFFNEKFGDSAIEPGQSGVYAFTFENRNPDALEFDLEFSCINEYGIELVYRLKRDGAYIVGGTDRVVAEGLTCENLTIEGESATVFEIEWYWRHNDGVDTAAGENQAVYTLNIRLIAWVGGQE